MRTPACQKFPEMYAGGEAPAKFATFDKERHSGTPVYRYGWIISRAELFEVLEGEPCPWDGLLYRISIAVDNQFFSWWSEKGYENNEYNPDIPCAKDAGPKYVVIHLACNDSPDIIKSIMENKKYHAECRACMGNPKSMESEPAWFRMDIKDIPKALSDGVSVAVGNVDK